jgi:hypothetical protein
MATCAHSPKRLRVREKPQTSTCGTVALGDAQQGNIGAIGGSDRRGGDALAADLSHHVHVAPRPLQPLPAPALIIDNPFREADGALDTQPGILDPLAEVAQAAAGPDVCFQLVHPRLDRLITGLGGNGDLAVDGDLLAADGAGVEGEDERGAAFVRSGNGCTGACQTGRTAGRHAAEPLTS